MKLSWMPFAFLAVALLFAEPANAQNTKGDKAPTTNPRGPFFRLPKILKSKSKGDRPNTRDISGRRRIRTKNESSANRVIYQQPDPYKDRKRKRTGERPGQPRGRTFSRAPREGQRAWTRTRDGSPLRIRSRSAQASRDNVYPQQGRYVNNKSSLQKKPKVYTRTARGKTIYQSKLHRERASRATGGYATASRPFITRGRKNVYWGKVSKGERPITKDLTGRPVRNRNFHSAGIGVGTTDTLRYVGRRPGRDRASSAKVSGGFVSASKRGERPWLRDVSGQRIRRRPPRRGERANIFFEAPEHAPSKRGERAGTMLRGGGFRTSKRKVGNSPLPARAPGIGANGIGKYRGNFQKGELSPGIGRQGFGYSGNMKARRPLKGGGSVSGKLWNNGRQPIQVRTGAPGSDRVARFPGNFKRGELSPGIGRQGFGYSGDMKARRPKKGGGSVSGKVFNNNGQPINVRPPGSNASKGVMYSGTIKARRPEKGGGSVSGKVWNNKEKPLPVQSGAPGFDRAARFHGNIKRSDLSPGIGRQGFGYSGNIKAKKPKHGGGSVSGKVFNNKGQPLEPELPSSAETKAVKYSGAVRLSRLKRYYVQNPNASDESLKKHKPKPNMYLVDGLQVRRKEEKTKKRSGAIDGALPGIRPKSGSVKAGEYDHQIKRYWSYKRNPSSNVNALKVVVPGKAYARVNDYQGNSKMKKYNDRRLHPDAQFAHGFRDNVKEDRTILMNLKLLWAKMFKKNDTQPEAVKAKEHKPRYDRKEKDLWKALYD